ncbi:MAG: putative NADH:ubiquinone oxidoreductase, subunit RnfE, partial [Oscillospiraceae bacterium]|nr:putative NADH:ubiquinone oxidoreductase, subunit RnfE [Oscillospiraceae bacterium]
MIRKFYQSHRKTFDLLEGLFVGNTVLERGLVVAPIIVASNTMQNAVTLGLGFLLITFITVFLSPLVPRKLPYTIRVILYVILAAVGFIPVSSLLNSAFPVAVYKVGIFLPLIVTNSLIVSKIESRFLKKRYSMMVIDLFAHVMGFFIVICIVGALREIFGNASFWGQPFENQDKAPALMLPFSGFI